MTWMKQFIKSEFPLHALALVLLTSLRNLGGRILSRLRDFFRAESKAGAILRAVLVFSSLVAVAEVTNRGRTIVQPFATLGLTDKERDLGRIVSDRIVKTLGLLRQEFRTDLLVILPSGSKEKGVVIAAHKPATAGTRTGLSTGEPRASLA